MTQVDPCSQNTKSAGRLMRRCLLILFCVIGGHWCTPLFSQRATADTIVIRSTAMNKDIKCVVIRPQTGDSLPVLYLLHGWSGNFSNWITKVPALKTYAELYHLMIVCPDGDYASWFVDSPVDPRSKYETYISDEVPTYIDMHYATRRDRGSRAITGLSMGGHGAIFLALRHASKFGAAGSMSGGLDLSRIKGAFDISKKLGDTTRLSANYINYSVIGAIEKKPADSIALTIDCGIDDGFISLNREVHQRMLVLKIAHDYTERPGKHNWVYWANSIRYQLLFFHDYFESQRVR